MTYNPADVKSIFLGAIESCPPGQWASYLDAACGNDTPLRLRVEELLKAHEELGSLSGNTPPVADTPSPYQPVAEQAGTQIGRYKLLEEIGEGGMGVVYLAEQQQPVLRQVALKIIKPGMDTRQVIARFEAERQALATMDHPNIAKVLDAGATDSGRPYFVMELVRGIPLTDYCDQNRLTIRERLALFVQVCRAVEHAHQKGIIHRDLKPAHLLVAIRDGVAAPKLVDFGIAKALKGQLTDKTLLTSCGQIVGTPLYMSPEQAELNGSDVDTRSDIYSLGVVLYELLTGSPPFDKERLREAGYDAVRRMIREEEPPRPSSRITTLGEAATTVSADRRTEPARLTRLLRRDLDWIVMKALDKDRARRYQTASDFARDIERYLDDEPIEARPPSLADRAAKWARRHRPLVWSAALMLGLAIVALAVSNCLISQERERTAAAYSAEKRQREEAQTHAAEAARQRQTAERLREEAEKQRDLAKRNLYLAQMRLAGHDWEAGRTSHLQRILDDFYPAAGEPDLRGWEWYHFLAQYHREEVSLRGHLDSVQAVAWSPDGRFLASLSTDQTLRVWEIATKQIVCALPGKPGDRWLVWGKDGKRLACAGWYGYVRVFETGTWGRVNSSGSLSQGTFTSADFASDAEQFSLPTKDNRVMIHNVANKKNRFLSGHRAPVTALGWSPDAQRLASASADGTIKVWDLASGQATLSFPAGDDPVLRLVWSPDGKWLASGGEHGTVVVIDASGGKEVSRLEGHRAAILSLAWDPDGRRLASASRDETIKVWDVAAGKEVRTLRGHLSGVNSVSWSPEGQRLASGSDDATVRIWDLNAPQEPSRIQAHGQAIWGLAWSPDSRQVATGGGDGKVKFWDAASGRELFAIREGGDEIHSISWCSDGRHFALAYEKTIEVWDLRARRKLYTAAGHSEPINSLGFSPNGLYLASVSGDASGQMVKIWDVSTGKEVASDRPHKLSGGGHAYASAWSPDGRCLAVTVMEGFNILSSTSLLFLIGGRQYGIASSHRGAVAWSPGGERAAAAWEHTIRIVSERGSREDIFSLSAHAGRVTALAWWPQGERLVSAGADGTMKLWDTAAGEEILTLQTGLGEIHGLLWSPDGRRLAAAGADGILRIWDASAGFRLVEIPAYIRELVQRVMDREEYPKAIATYRRAADRYPMLPEYRFALAQTLFDDYRYEEPLQILKKLIAEFPSASEYRRELAMYLDVLGRTAEAIPILEKLVADCPNSAVDQFALGRCLIRADRSAEALALFERLKARSPKIGEYQVGLAMSLVALGREEEAKKGIPEVAQRLIPVPGYVQHRAKFFQTRSKSRRYGGDLDPALVDANRAIWTNPGDAGNFHVRALVYASKNEPDRTIRDCTLAIALSEGPFWFYRDRGIAYAQKKEWEKAIADFTAGMEVSPNNLVLYLERARAYAGTGQFDKASADLSEALRRFPKSVEPHGERCLLYLRMGRFNEAISEATEVMHLDASPVTCNNLAWLLATSADFKPPDPAKAEKLAQRAIELAQKAVELEPEQASFWNTMGAARYREAIAALEKSVELRSGGDAFDWFFLTMAHWQLGHQEDARRWYDRAVAWMDKNAPKNAELLRFRAEAAELLGLAGGQSAEKQKR